MIPVETFRMAHSVVELALDRVKHVGKYQDILCPTKLGYS